MKLIHLADLHLGKRLNEFSLLDDQKFILDEISRIIAAEQPDGVLLAGDIYDKAVPPAEAVELFDNFLVDLARQKLQVFIISGNHDSPERLAFGGRLLDASGIHIAPVYNGQIAPCSLQDAYGQVDIFMLPFIKPAHVRRFFPEADIESYTEAVRLVIQNMPVNPANRKVLLTHQFVTGASRCDSEDFAVGGSDNIEAAVFDGFDYAALGHIHRPQNVGSEKIRYAGTPLKYSFSEAAHQKSVTVVELDAVGLSGVRTVPLVPQHDLLEIKGTYSELTLKSYYENTVLPNSYLHITLTDEEDICDAIGKLRVIYPRLLKLDYDNRRTRCHAEVSGTEAALSQSPLELFAQFYELQNNAPLSAAQTAFVQNLIQKIWEDEQ